MKSISWKDIAELIGITAIVASLIFVGLQLQQTQDIANADMASKFLVDDIEWVNLVNANSDVWIRGNKGDELDELETSIYRNLAWVRDSISFIRYRQLERLGRMQGETIVADYATHLHQNPGARREWERRTAERIKYRQPLLANRNPDIVAPATGVDDYGLLIRTMVEELDRLYGQ